LLVRLGYTQVVITLYFYPSPNALKATIMLEECGLTYRVSQVDITRGAQFEPDFLKISPNNKIPAMVVDNGGAPPLSIFESGAILMFLAESTGRFLPHELQGRFRVLQWLFWQVGGLGPMAGQAHHFRKFAPEQVPYGIKRYTDEVNRLYGVLERTLAENEWIAVDYSIADIAVYPWLMHHDKQGQHLEDFPNTHRWYQAMGARPGVRRGISHGHERLADEIGHTHLYGQTADVVKAREYAARKP
jgi:GST-like protein